MARMLTEEEVKRLEQQRAESENPRRMNWNLGMPMVGSQRKTSRQLGREATRLQGLQKKPNYGEGLTDEDQRAIKLLDNQKIEGLKRQAGLERVIEGKQKEEAKKGLAASTKEELVEAYDDLEGTPEYLREAIRGELQKRGLTPKDYDRYRWTDTGVETREARIKQLQKEFDIAQTEQQKWAELATTHENAKMRKRYRRWAEQQEGELDEIEKELEELRGLKPERKIDE